MPVGLKYAGLTIWRIWSDRLSTERLSNRKGRKSSLRIALVKSSECRELYTKVSPCEAGELLASSTWRSGPFGLFTSLGAEFIIVRPSAAPECSVYQQRDALHPETKRLRAICREMQDRVSVDAMSVDWSKYDVVIAYDDAIPTLLAQRYPGVFWATMHEDHRMASYAKSRKTLPGGYDAFLNLRLGPSPHDMARKKWEIDFSYGFKGSDGFGTVFKNVEKVECVCVEDHHSDNECAVAQRSLGVQVARPHATGLMDYLGKVKTSKVFWIPEPDRPLGGLAALDATALGCVVVANRNRIWNAHTILPELHCTGWGDGIRIVDRLLRDDQYYRSCLQKQADLMNWYNFERPLEQLRKAILSTPRELSAKICM